MKFAFALLLIATVTDAAQKEQDLDRASGVAALRSAYAAQSKGQTSVTPVEKVIQLLQGMVEKGKKEKAEEAAQYNAYKQWCDETTVEKTRRIAEANELIDSLKADILKYEADITELTKQIAEHDEDISTWQNDIKAATNVREIEKADYEAKHQDYEESIDALGRAIKVLKDSAKDVKQASFAQISKLKTFKLIPDDAKKAIDAFFQDPEDELSVAAPEANAYEYQSHGIIDMLEKLLNKFTDELTDLEKQEAESKHAFAMLIDDMNMQIEDSTARRDEKAAEKAKKMQAKAEAEALMEDTIATRDDDMKYLADVTATCEQKASDFADRQKLRADEIVALEQAIEILSSDSVTGNAVKHLPTMLQTKAAASFAQLRSDGRSPSQSRVADYLRIKSKKLNSRILATLAVRVDADPFVKVRKMIKDLIARLQEEAAEEAEHKGWCDNELATNEATRKEKTEAVEMLHAEVDELEAKISKQTEEITDLQTGIAELDAAVKKATAMRQAEKAKNTETIADAKESQEAVSQAMTILKEFYAKAGEATALMQQPEIFDAPYKGMQAENGGVIGMLEVIQSDFARLEAETTAAEDSAQKEYDQFMADSEADKAQKERDIERLVTKKQDASQRLEETKADLLGTTKELDAALAYYDKLRPDCIETGISYEERVARRKEEIESLQEALRILNGEEIASESE
jgi:DNA repair exonuclease SbcCD ATPase subunit